MMTQAPTGSTRSRAPVRVVQGLALVWFVVGTTVVTRAGHPADRAHVLLWGAGFLLLLVVMGALDVRSRR